jgi:hypothetical protein
MVKKIKQFFPTDPRNSTWSDINGDLQIYYGQLNIPDSSEENWKETANQLASSPEFSTYAIPNPDNAQNWQEWVSDFATVVNGKTK